MRLSHYLFPQIIEIHTLHGSAFRSIMSAPTSAKCEERAGLWQGVGSRTACVGFVSKFVSHGANMSEKKQPTHFNARQLHKFSVEIADPHSTCVCGARSGGQVWSPNLGAGGRLPNGYWRCPNGCNTHLGTVDGTDPRGESPARNSGCKRGWPPAVAPAEV